VDTDKAVSEYAKSRVEGFGLLRRINEELMALGGGLPLPGPGEEFSLDLGNSLPIDGARIMGEWPDRNLDRGPGAQGTLERGPLFGEPGYTGYLGRQRASGGVGESGRHGFSGYDVQQHVPQLQPQLQWILTGEEIAEHTGNMRQHYLSYLDYLINRVMTRAAERTAYANYLLQDKFKPNIVAEETRDNARLELLLAKIDQGTARLLAARKHTVDKTEEGTEKHKRALKREDLAEVEVQSLRLEHMEKKLEVMMRWRKIYFSQGAGLDIVKFTARIQTLMVNIDQLTSLIEENKSNIAKGEAITPYDLPGTGVATVTEIDHAARSTKASRDEAQILGCIEEGEGDEKRLTIVMQPGRVRVTPEYRESEGSRFMEQSFSVLDGNGNPILVHGSKKVRLELGTSGLLPANYPKSRMEGDISIDTPILERYMSPGRYWVSSIDGFDSLTGEPQSVGIVPAGKITPAGEYMFANALCESEPVDILLRDGRTVTQRRLVVKKVVLRYGTDLLGTELNSIGRSAEGLSKIGDPIDIAKGEVVLVPTQDGLKVISIRAPSGANPEQDEGIEVQDLEEWQTDRERESRGKTLGKDAGDIEDVIQELMDNEGEPVTMSAERVETLILAASKKIDELSEGEQDQLASAISQEPVGNIQLTEEQSEEERSELAVTLSKVGEDDPVTLSIGRTASGVAGMATLGLIFLGLLQAKRRGRQRPTGPTGPPPSALPAIAVPSNEEIPMMTHETGGPKVKWSGAELRFARSGYKINMPEDGTRVTQEEERLLNRLMDDVATGIEADKRYIRGAFRGMAIRVYDGLANPIELSGLAGISDSPGTVLRIDASFFKGLREKELLYVFRHVIAPAVAQERSRRYRLEREYATLAEERGDSPIALTPAGIERLRKWIERGRTQGLPENIISACEASLERVDLAEDLRPKYAQERARRRTREEVRLARERLRNITHSSQIIIDDFPGEVKDAAKALQLDLARAEETQPEVHQYGGIGVDNILFERDTSLMIDGIVTDTLLGYSNTAEDVRGALISGDSFTVTDLQAFDNELRTRLDEELSSGSLTTLEAGSVKVALTLLNNIEYTVTPTQEIIVSAEATDLGTFLIDTEIASPAVLEEELELLLAQLDDEMSDFEDVLEFSPGDTPDYKILTRGDEAVIVSLGQVETKGVDEAINSETSDREIAESIAIELREMDIRERNDFLSSRVSVTECLSKRFSQSWHEKEENAARLMKAARSLMALTSKESGIFWTNKDDALYEIAQGVRDRDMFLFDDEKSSATRDFLEYHPDFDGFEVTERSIERFKYMLTVPRDPYQEAIFPIIQATHLDVPISIDSDLEKEEMVRRSQAARIAKRLLYEIVEANDEEIEVVIARHTDQERDSQEFKELMDKFWSSLMKGLESGNSLDQALNGACLKLEDDFGSGIQLVTMFQDMRKAVTSHMKYLEERNMLVAYMEVAVQGVRDTKDGVPDRMARAICNVSGDKLINAAMEGDSFVISQEITDALAQATNAIRPPLVIEKEGEVTPIGISPAAIEKAKELREEGKEVSLVIAGTCTPGEARFLMDSRGPVTVYTSSSVGDEFFLHEAIAGREGDASLDAVKEAVNHPDVEGILKKTLEERVSVEKEIARNEALDEKWKDYATSLTRRTRYASLRRDGDNATTQRIKNALREVLRRDFGNHRKAVLITDHTWKALGEDGQKRFTDAINEGRDSDAAQELLNSAERIVKLNRNAPTLRYLAQVTPKLAFAVAIVAVAGGAVGADTQDDVPSVHSDLIQASQGMLGGDAATPSQPVLQRTVGAEWQLAMGPKVEIEKEKKMTPERQKKIQKCLHYLQSWQSYIVRADAAFDLGFIGDETVIDDLIPLLNNTSETIRRSAAGALGRISKRTGDAQAVPHLMRALSDKDSGVRLSAIRALTTIGEPATAYLTTNLRSPNKRIRENSREVLRDMGETAHASLVRALGHESSYVRAVSLLILAETGNEKQVEPVLVLLNDTDEIVRGNAAYTLGKIGSKEVIPHLIGAFQDKSEKVSRRAASALANVGRDAVPQLLEAAASDAPRTRWCAAIALGKIGREESVDILNKLATDESGHSSVITEAESALKLVEGRSIKTASSQPEGDSDELAEKQASTLRSRLPGLVSTAIQTKIPPGIDYYRVDLLRLSHKKEKEKERARLRGASTNALDELYNLCRDSWHYRSNEQVNNLVVGALADIAVRADDPKVATFAAESLVGYDVLNIRHLVRIARESTSERVRGMALDSIEHNINRTGVRSLLGELAKEDSVRNNDALLARVNGLLGKVPGITREDLTLAIARTQEKADEFEKNQEELATQRWFLLLQGTPAIENDFNALSRAVDDQLRIEIGFLESQLPLTKGATLDRIEIQLDILKQLREANRELNTAGYIPIFTDGQLRLIEYNPMAEKEGAFGRTGMDAAEEVCHKTAGRILYLVSNYLETRISENEEKILTLDGLDKKILEAVTLQLKERQNQCVAAKALFTLGDPKTREATSIEDTLELQRDFNSAVLREGKALILEAALRASVLSEQWGEDQDNKELEYQLHYQRDVVLASLRYQYDMMVLSASLGNPLTPSSSPMKGISTVAMRGFNIMSLTPQVAGLEQPLSEEPIATRTRRLREQEVERLRIEARALELLNQFPENLPAVDNAGERSQLISDEIASLRQEAEKIETAIEEDTPSGPMQVGPERTDQLQRRQQLASLGVPGMPSSMLPIDHERISGTNRLVGSDTYRTATIEVSGLNQTLAKRGEETFSRVLLPTEGNPINITFNQTEGDGIGAGLYVSQVGPVFVQGQRETPDGRVEEGSFWVTTDGLLPPSCAEGSFTLDVVGQPNVHTINPEEDPWELGRDKDERLIGYSVHQVRDTVVTTTQDGEEQESVQPRSCNVGILVAPVTDQVYYTLDFDKLGDPNVFSWRNLIVGEGSFEVEGLTINVTIPEEDTPNIVLRGKVEGADEFLLTQFTASPSSEYVDQINLIREKLLRLMKAQSDSMTIWESYTAVLEEYERCYKKGYISYENYKGEYERFHLLYDKRHAQQNLMTAMVAAHQEVSSCHTRYMEMRGGPEELERSAYADYREAVDKLFAQEIDVLEYMVKWNIQLLGLQERDFIRGNITFKQFLNYRDAMIDTTEDLADMIELRKMYAKHLPVLGVYLPMQRVIPPVGIHSNRQPYGPSDSMEQMYETFPAWYIEGQWYTNSQTSFAQGQWILNQIRTNNTRRPAAATDASPTGPFSAMEALPIVQPPKGEYTSPKYKKLREETVEEVKVVLKKMHERQINRERARQRIADRRMWGINELVEKYGEDIIGRLNFDAEVDKYRQNLDKEDRISVIEDQIETIDQIKDPESLHGSLIQLLHDKRLRLATKLIEIDEHVPYALNVLASLPSRYDAYNMRDLVRTRDMVEIEGNVADGLHRQYELYELMGFAPPLIDTLRDHSGGIPPQSFLPSVHTTLDEMPDRDQVRAWAKEFQETAEKTTVGSALHARTQAQRQLDALLEHRRLYVESFIPKGYITPLQLVGLDMNIAEKRIEIDEANLTMTIPDIRKLPEGSKEREDAIKAFNMEILKLQERRCELAHRGSLLDQGTLDINIPMTERVRMSTPFTGDGQALRSFYVHLNKEGKNRLEQDEQRLAYFRETMRLNPTWFMDVPGATRSDAVTLQHLARLAEKTLDEARLEGCVETEDGSGVVWVMTPGRGMASRMSFDSGNQFGADTLYWTEDGEIVAGAWLARIQGDYAPGIMPPYFEESFGPGYIAAQNPITNENMGSGNVYVWNIEGTYTMGNSIRVGYSPEEGSDEFYRACLLFGTEMTEVQTRNQGEVEQYLPSVEGLLVYPVIDSDSKLAKIMRTTKDRWPILGKVIPIEEGGVEVIDTGEGPVTIVCRSARWWENKMPYLERLTGEEAERIAEDPEALRAQEATPRELEDDEESPDVDVDEMVDGFLNDLAARAPYLDTEEVGAVAKAKPKVARQIAEQVDSAIAEVGDEVIALASNEYYGGLNEAMLSSQEAAGEYATTGVMPESVEKNAKPVKVEVELAETGEHVRVSVNGRQRAIALDGEDKLNQEEAEEEIGSTVKGALYDLALPDVERDLGRRYPGLSVATSNNVDAEATYRAKVAIRRGLDTVRGVDQSMVASLRGRGVSISKIEKEGREEIDVRIPGATERNPIRIDVTEGQDNIDSRLENETVAAYMQLASLPKSEQELWGGMCIPDEGTPDEQFDRAMRLQLGLPVTALALDEEEGYGIYEHQCAFVGSLLEESSTGFITRESLVGKQQVRNKLENLPISARIAAGAILAGVFILVSGIRRRAKKTRATEERDKLRAPLVYTAWVSAWNRTYPEENIGLEKALLDDTVEIAIEPEMTLARDFSTRTSLKWNALSGFDTFECASDLCNHYRTEKGLNARVAEVVTPIGVEFVAAVQVAGKWRYFSRVPFAPGTEVDTGLISNDLDLYEYERPTVRRLLTAEQEDGYLHERLDNGILLSQENGTLLNSRSVEDATIASRLDIDVQMRQDDQNIAARPYEAVSDGEVVKSQDMVTLNITTHLIRGGTRQRTTLLTARASAGELAGLKEEFAIGPRSTQDCIDLLTERGVIQDPRELGTAEISQPQERALDDATQRARENLVAAIKSLRLPAFGPEAEPVAPPTKPDVFPQLAKEEVIEHVASTKGTVLDGRLVFEAQTGAAYMPGQDDANVDHLSKIAPKIRPIIAKLQKATIGSENDRRYVRRALQGKTIRLCEGMANPLELSKGGNTLRIDPRLLKGLSERDLLFLFRRVIAPEIAEIDGKKNALDSEFPIQTRIVDSLTPAGRVRIGRRVDVLTSENQADPIIEHIRLGLAQFDEESRQDAIEIQPQTVAIAPQREDLAALWDENVTVNKLIKTAQALLEHERELFYSTNNGDLQAKLSGSIDRLEWHLETLEDLDDLPRRAYIRTVLAGKYDEDAKEAIHQLDDEFFFFNHAVGTVLHLEEGDKRVKKAVTFFRSVLRAPDVAEQILRLASEGEGTEENPYKLSGMPANFYVGSANARPDDRAAPKQYRIPILGHVSEEFGVNTVITGNARKDTATLAHEIGGMLGLGDDTNKRLEEACYAWQRRELDPAERDELRKLIGDTDESVVTREDGRVLMIDTGLERKDLAAIPAGDVAPSQTLRIAIPESVGVSEKSEIRRVVSARVAAIGREVQFIECDTSDGEALRNTLGETGRFCLVVDADPKVVEASIDKVLSEIDQKMNQEDVNSVLEAQPLFRTEGSGVALLMEALKDGTLTRRIVREDADFTVSSIDVFAMAQGDTAACYEYSSEMSPIPEEQDTDVVLIPIDAFEEDASLKERVISRRMQAQMRMTDGTKDPLDEMIVITTPNPRRSREDRAAYLQAIGIDDSLFDDSHIITYEDIADELQIAGLEQEQIETQMQAFFAQGDVGQMRTVLGRIAAKKLNRAQINDEDIEIVSPASLFMALVKIILEGVSDLSFYEVVVEGLVRNKQIDQVTAERLRAIDTDVLKEGVATERIRDDLDRRKEEIEEAKATMRSA